MALARVVAFDGVTSERMAEMQKEMEGNDPPEGFPSAELLILHPQHPRSVRFNVALAQSSLRRISGSGPHSYANEAERLTGKLHDSMVYDRIEDIFARDLHVFLTDVEHTCRRIGEQIAGTYFYYAGVAS